jgi:transcriptional regulator with XRE-family HTH domain
MANGVNPALQSRRLRGVLKQARADAALTQEQAADRLDWSLSKIVRIESGSVGVSITDLRALLREYKISDTRSVSQIVEMGRAAKARPWYKDYAGVASKRYLAFVEFEQAAVASWHYQCLFVPGILQTRDYATAILSRLAKDMDETKAEGLLEFRMRRQELLDAQEPPNYSFVVDQSVLYRRVGAPDVIPAQIDRLIELAARPNISIQIYPFSAGITNGMQAPFVIHQIQDEPDVLYMESPRGDTLVADDMEEVNRYRDTFKELRGLALSESDSMSFLKGLER